MSHDIKTWSDDRDNDRLLVHLAQDGV